MKTAKLTLLRQAWGEPNEGPKSIWLCDRCYRAIRSQTIPKFSRASGFRLRDVPEELAALNRIEARLVGLGISFTTCVNLYRDEQEFTRGNAINYWNEPGEVVRELPRPLKSCGVVFLAAKSDKATNYFRIPSIPVTDDEVQALRGHVQQLNSVNANTENSSLNAENIGLVSNLGEDVNFKKQVIGLLTALVILKRTI
ncbi:hypothetical protein F442_16638 [Phytophthora nicotianae P10297]|uniref:DUF6570 domain-containing protein n=1 Tax=Phytophthora nicotianae P10297 TaxID=1317064 RepID=W2YJ76_PHYNI|nr:hypothetical protein F442_16638 [Phytophthora nicotianae P10297]